MCYSSPPLRYCPVCQGSYEYGPKMTALRRDVWWSKFLELLDAEEFRFLYPHRARGGGIARDRRGPWHS